MKVSYCLFTISTFLDHRESSSDESHSDGESSSSSGGHDERNHSSSENDSRCGSRSGSPTPCNSPQSTLVRKKSGGIKKSYTGGSGGKGGISASKKGNINLNTDYQRGLCPTNSANNSLGRNISQQQKQLSSPFALGGPRSLAQENPPSEQSTLRSTRSSGGASMVSGDANDGKMVHQEKSRFLTLVLMKNSSNLGVCLVGGNVVGIFIHSVQPESVADRAGLRYVFFKLFRLRIYLVRLAFLRF